MVVKKEEQKRREVVKAVDGQVVEERDEEGV